MHSYSETLACELEQFNVRVTVIAPGAFRTEGIYENPQFLETPIEDYEQMRLASKERIKAIPGKQKGGMYRRCSHQFIPC